MEGFSLTKRTASKATIVNYNNIQKVFKTHFDIEKKYRGKLFTVGL